MKIDSRLAAIFGARVPIHTQEALCNYLIHGYQPGGFLTALLSKDLYTAAFIADFANQDRFVDIVKCIAHHFPKECWGDKRIIYEWCRKTEEERRKILVKYKLVHSVVEILKTKDVSQITTDTEYNF